MTLTIQYQINFNLQQRAALSLAIWFWERKEVKTRIKKFFDRYGKLQADEAINNWYKLTKTLLSEWNHCILNSKLKYELCDFIKEIGEKIYNWYLFIENENNYQNEKETTTADYIEKIYWTPYGTVNENEILKSFWINNPNLDVVKVYNIACKFALKDYINVLWYKIPSHIQNNAFNHCIMCSDRHLLKYWILLKDGNLPQFKDSFEAGINARYGNMSSYHYNGELSPTMNMFRLSVYEGYITAVKYFWQYLTEREKRKNLSSTARITIKRFNEYEYEQKGVEQYKNEKYVEICIFLINQMPIPTRAKFFNETVMLEPCIHDRRDVKGEVLRMLLTVWPWHNIVLPMFNDLFESLKQNTQTINTLFNTITWKINEDRNQNNAKNSKLSGILRTIWFELPKSIKQEICQRSNFQFMRDLFNAWDIDSIKLILNDLDIIEYREQHIESGKAKYISLVKNGQYELLDQLMKDLYLSEKEVKLLKETINVWDHFIQTNQYEKVDKLLDWQSNTEEKKFNLKSRIDHVMMCEYFMKKEEYQWADKFLSWKFDTEEEIKKTKTDIANNEAAVHKIFTIWSKFGKTSPIAKQKSNQFVDWLLESPDEIKSFKNEKLVNGQLTNFIIEYFIERNQMYVTNSFLSWCSLTKKQIRQVKLLIGYKIGHNVCNYEIQLGYTSDAEQFLKWAFTHDDPMRSFITEFITSDTGITSCHIYIKDENPLSRRSYPGYEERVDNKYKKFINFWIKPLNNIDEFMAKFTTKKMDAFMMDPVYRKNREIFIDLVEKLKDSRLNGTETP